MNIDTMVAGREMDALVGERVMGKEVSKSCLCAHGCSCPRHDESALPHYSTSMFDAWEVVRLLHMAVREKPDGSSRAWASNGPTVEADNAPLAICRAALKAMA